MDSYKPVGCTVLEGVSCGMVEKRGDICQVPSINHMDISNLLGANPLLGVGDLTTQDLGSGMWNCFAQAGPSNLLELMRKASNGELAQMDVGDCSMQYTSIEEYPDEEEYYGGVESEQATESSDDDGYEDDSVLLANNSTDKNKSSNEHISQFDDKISNEDFNYGRDCIYDSWELGIDDTDMNETEVEGDIGQDLCLLSSLGEVGESSEQDQSCCYGTNGVGTPDLLGGCGCQHVEMTQEISQKHLEELKLGYKKRNKNLKHAIAVDCRNPRDMGAIEIALRTRCHRVTECIFEPILGMVFDSKEEAYDFYNMYSWELGFGVIYNTRKCSGTEDNKYISMQEITCKKGGHDPRTIESTKKDKCQARIQLYSSKI